MDKNSSQWKWLYELVSLPQSDTKLPCFLSLLPTILPPFKPTDETRHREPAELVCWWMLHKHHYADFFWENESIYAKILSEPATDVIQDAFLTFSKSIIYTWRHREDLRNAYPLNDQESRNGFAYWWITQGPLEYDFLKLTEGQKAELLSPATGVHQDTMIPIPRGLLVLWQLRTDLRQAFDLSAKEGREALIQWWLQSWREDCPYLPPSGEKEISPSFPTKAVASITQSVDNCDASGINIIGFPKGELGIGEDSRMAAKSSLANNIPFCLIEAPIAISSEMSENNLNQFISSIPRYQTNLFCLPGQITYQLLLTQGTEIFNQRYNIGAWQWELPHWPEYMTPLFNMVQEIWAISDYVAAMFRASVPDFVKVVHMPLAVEVPNIPAIPRSDFQLPEGRFLFLVMFDSNSWIQRKNPMAAVQAFLKAFANNNQDVGLVVKVMNANENSADWQLLQKIAAYDPRIIILNKRLTRHQTIGLISCCDAYVSLHRAEGFGRILAEAMLLGKPVIATNFSGNTDFTTKETAFLVDGPTVELKPGDYSEWEGQSWCEPDVDMAAAQMQLCWEDVQRRKHIADAGQAFVQLHHSANTVGRLYRQRLQEIGIALPTT